LGNYGEWMQAEREFRLCQSLRTAVREAETLSAAFAGRVSTNDWNVLVDQMQTILATEGELAFFISEQLAELASNAHNDAQTTAVLRDAVRSLRIKLTTERQQLIQKEVELFSIV